MPRDYALEIINQALLRISQEPGADMADTKPAFVAARTMLHQVVDEAASEWEWSFATRSADLASPQLDGWYVVPEDAIRVLSVEPDYATWSLIGREIKSSELEELTVNYVGSMIVIDEISGYPTIPDWISPKFQAACACRLAAELAPKYAGNVQLLGAFQQEYMVLLRQARSQDALGAENATEPPEDWREA